MNETNQKPLTLKQATRPTAPQANAEVKAWQDEQTRQAIKQADAGDFATAEELKATVRKFVPHG